MPKGLRGQVQATCHPDKKHVAHGLCAACYHREWKQADRQRGRNNHLMVKYQMTDTTYMKMLDEQEGVCAICSEPNPDGRRLSVDHSHETGVIRQLLCGRCNSGLGFFRDRPELLAQASSYLERHTNA